MASQEVRDSWKKSTKKYNERQIQKGLCRHCPEPIYKNKRCLYHYQKDSLANQNKKIQRKLNNKCIECGKPLLEEEYGRSVCINCALRLRPIKLYETIAEEST